MSVASKNPFALLDGQCSIISQITLYLFVFDPSQQPMKTSRRLFQPPHSLRNPLRSSPRAPRQLVVDREAEVDPRPEAEGTISAAEEEVPEPRTHQKVVRKQPLLVTTGGVCVFLVDSQHEAIRADHNIYNLILDT